MVRSVESHDSLIYGRDTAQVYNVYDDGTVHLVRKRDYRHMPVEVIVDIEDIKITHPDGEFIGQYGRVHGRVDTSDDDDEEDDAHGDSDGEQDTRDAQDNERTQATLSGFNGGDY